MAYIFLPFSFAIDSFPQCQPKEKLCFLLPTVDGSVAELGPMDQALKSFSVVFSVFCCHRDLRVLARPVI